MYRNRSSFNFHVIDKHVSWKIFAESDENEVFNCSDSRMGKVQLRFHEHIDKLQAPIDLEQNNRIQWCMSILSLTRN